MPQYRVPWLWYTQPRATCAARAPAIYLSHTFFRNQPGERGERGRGRGRAGRSRRRAHDRGRVQRPPGEEDPRQVQVRRCARRVRARARGAAKR